MAAARWVLPPRCLAGTSWPVRMIPNASTCNFSALANPTCPFKGKHVKPNNLDIRTIHPGNGNKFSHIIYEFITYHKSRAMIFYAQVYSDRENTLWLVFMEVSKLDRKK